MPSTSKKQHNLMALVANDPAAAKRLGIPQKVGKDFMEADKGRKFAKGGEMKESKAMMKKEISFMKAKGAPKSMVKHEESEMKSAKKMAFGGTSGRAMPIQSNAGGASRGLDRAAAMSGRTMPTIGGMKSGGKTKKMASGGLSAGHKSADGIVSKGKTKAKQITMAGNKGMKKGGKIC